MVVILASGCWLWMWWFCGWVWNDFGQWLLIMAVVLLWLVLEILGASFWFRDEFCGVNVVVLVSLVLVEGCGGGRTMVH